MPITLGSRLKRVWNAFFSRDQTEQYQNVGYGSFYRPDRVRFVHGSERTIVTSVYNRIALDVSAVNIRHTVIDENGYYLREVSSGLNRCLTESANVDQTGSAFIQDVVMSLLDEGCVAIIPIDTDGNPKDGEYDILSMRTGKITDWYPYHIRVNVYNEHTGRRQDICCLKTVARLSKIHFMRL